jgi:hypothetical protein
MLGCGREIAQVSLFRRFSHHGYWRMTTKSQVAKIRDLLFAISYAHG